MKTLITFFKIACKTILFFLICLDFISPAYSQQNSKIVNSLQGELKDKKLYFELVDSVAKKFEQEKIVIERNSILPDFRKVPESRHHETSFENLIKVIPTNLKLFNQYKIDTISFYFIQKKLVKCWYQFDLPTKGYNSRDKAVDSIYSKLNHSFNLGYDGVETNIADYRGYRWTDDYAEVNFLTDIPIPPNMIVGPSHIDLSKAYLSIEFFKSAERNQLLEKQSQLIKKDRVGQGNNSFTFSINKLENIIKSRSLLKTVEHQFGHWTSYGAFNQVQYEYDDQTNAFTSPLFRLHYESKIGRRNFTFVFELQKNLNNPITYFEVTTILNGLQLAEFKNSLTANNYLLNENLTRILNKLAFQNRAKKSMITIVEKYNGEYTIGIR